MAPDTSHKHVCISDTDANMYAFQTLIDANMYLRCVPDLFWITDLMHMEHATSCTPHAHLMHTSCTHTQGVLHSM